MSPRFYLLALAVIMATPRPAWSLVIANGTAANSDADPTSAPAAVWNNVGFAGDSTGEYLGNGWIITANHVVRTDATHIIFSLTIGATTYNWTGVGSQLGSHDIFLAHLDPDGSGNLPDAYGATGLPLTTATPAVTTPVSLIGMGFQNGATNYYTVSGSTWTLSTMSDSNSVAVYNWGSSKGKLWGTNTIWGTSAAGSTIGGHTLASQTVAGDNALAIDLSAIRHGPLPASQDTPTSSEAVAATYDSGGAMLVKVGGVWQLAGLVDTVNAWQGQPGNTSTVDDSTFAIDLASYASQINSITGVPEPSATALLAMAPLLAGRRFRRRDRR